MQEVPVHRCIGPTWVDSYQALEIGLAEGVMKLPEGVTSKLWLWGKIFVGKMDKHIRAEDLRKGATPLVGPATEIV